MLEKLERGLAKNWILFVTLMIVSIVGLLLRWQGIWYESGDYTSCLSIWMDVLKNGDGLSVLAAYDGDYNMPYVTVLLLLSYLPLEPIISIKGVSMLFDIICAFAAGLLVIVCTKSKYKTVSFVLTYGAVFLSPIAILNSGYWGQCDSIYVAFVLLAVVCMLKEKHPLAMIFWGCAFAFKLQAIFGFPIVLLYYWKTKKFSLTQFFIIPITMEILCIPAIIGGCSPLVTFSVYFSQMKTFPHMYYYYPNIWTFFQDTPYYVFGKMAIVGTFVLLLIEALIILRKEETFENSHFLPKFVWLVMTILCFLPCMHDRYGYMLEMVAICYAVTNKKIWWLPIGLQVITMFVYAPGILRWHIVDARILAIGYLLLFIALSYTQLKHFTSKADKEVGHV